MIHLWTLWPALDVSLMGSLNVGRADHKAAVFCIPCSGRQHLLCCHNPNFHHSQGFILNSACRSHMHFLMSSSCEFWLLLNWAWRIGTQREIEL